MTPSPIFSGHLNPHQEAEYHTGSLRKTFLKSDTAVEAVIFSLSTNEADTQAAIILVRKRRRRTKITSLVQRKDRFSPNTDLLLTAEDEAAETVGASKGVAGRITGSVSKSPPVEDLKRRDHVSH